MTICDNIRKTLKSYIDDGKSAAAAYKAFKNAIPRSTLYRWYDVVKNGKAQAISKRGRLRTVRSKAFMEKVRRNLCSNKKRKSARSLGKDEMIRGSIRMAELTDKTTA